METDVKELVRLVVASGQEIEESSEFLHRMSELVKKGTVFFGNPSYRRIFKKCLIQSYDLFKQVSKRQLRSYAVKVKKRCGRKEYYDVFHLSGHLSVGSLHPQRKPVCVEEH